MSCTPPTTTDTPRTRCRPDLGVKARRSPMKLHDTIDVLIGGYMSKDAAEDDYERRPRQSVPTCREWRSIAKDLEGNLSVERDRSHGSRGSGGPRRRRVGVGLAAPPLLATTAIGAALGAGGGKLLHHKTADKIGEQAGETIPLGGAGLIVVYSHSEADQVEPAVTRAVKQVKGRGRGAPRPGREGCARGRSAEDGRRAGLKLRRRGRSESRRCRRSCPVSCPVGPPLCSAGSRSRGRDMSRPSGS